MKKTYNIIYWVSTLLLTGVFMFSIYIHLFKTGMVEGFYESLGFPAWLVIPSGFLKILALTAILSNQSKVLKEWAYAGLFFDAIIAFAAHQIAQDGGYLFAGIAILMVIVSRVSWFYVEKGKVEFNR